MYTYPCVWATGRRKKEKGYELKVYSDDVNFGLRMIKDKEIRKGKSTKVANGFKLNTTKAPSALAQ